MAAGIRDVAAAASVSAGTVSNALNAPERVAPTTVARVNAATESPAAETRHVVFRPELVARASTAT